jgi:hypothetical protein
MKRRRMHTPSNGTIATTTSAGTSPPGKQGKNTCNKCISTMIEVMIYEWEKAPMRLEQPPGSENTIGSTPDNSTDTLSASLEYDTNLGASASS